MSRLAVDTSIQQGMAQAIQLGYRIELPRISRRPGTVTLVSLTCDPVDQRDDIAPEKIADAIVELLQDRPATGELDHGRWGRGASPGYDWQRCRYCGCAGSDHERTVCRACDMPQCLISDKCRVCLVGYLVGIWRGYGDDAICGYKSCTNEVVASAPRVKKVCREHLPRVTRRRGGRTVSLAEDIDQAVAMLGQTYGVCDWQRTYWFNGGAR